MFEEVEQTHPLRDIELNIYGVKCFGEQGSGRFQFAPITFVIGKNNSGKSTILDVLQECCRRQGRMFEGPLSRAGSNPLIEITTRPSEGKLRSTFPANISGGSIPGSSHWHYAEHNILPFRFTWTFDRNREANIKDEGKHFEDLVTDAKNRLSGALDFPFSRLWLVRIRAERDVQPEKRDTNRQLESNGRGLTNLVRAFINSEDLPREAVEAELLQDLNSIYLGDSNFTEIICQENESSAEWEIFLREEGKGDIRLSQSGSSLKTVFLVLAFFAPSQQGPKDWLNVRTDFLFGGAREQSTSSAFKKADRLPCTRKDEKSI